MADIDSTRRLDSVFAQAPVAITILVGPDFTVEQMNSLALRVWGQGRATARIGQPMHTFLDDHHRDVVVEILQSVRKTGQPRQQHQVPIALHSSSNSDGDRDLRYFDFVYQPLQEGGDSAILITGSDVSESVRLTAQRKDEFLATLAHELRNPMAPIVNAVHLLRLPQATGPVVQRAIDAIDRQVGHMVRLVDDLLDLSRINTGKVELRKERVALSTIVDHAVQTSAPLMQKHEHEFVLTMPPEQIRLLADRTRLTQVVANLLNNAAKYSPPKTRIDLTCALDGGEVVLTVRDQGIGIRPEMLEHVFDLFVQSDRTPDRSQGGLGIGLTLVKSLVEMHGGTVSAHSEGPGRGSEFVVRLPVVDTRTLPPPPLESRVPSAVAAGLRVMVVEDNVDVRETLRDFLRLSGHEVSVAEDGPSAVEALVEASPQVALVDIGLPGLDGYGVVRAVRARAPRIPTVFIALTGYGQPQDRQRAFDAGFHDHLVKPVDSDVLIRLLEETHSLIGKDQ